MSLLNKATVEAGKRYYTRMGDLTGPAQPAQGGFFLYNPYHGQSLFYSKTGKSGGENYISNEDLIEEVGTGYTAEVWHKNKVLKRQSSPLILQAAETLQRVSTGFYGAPASATLWFE